MDLKLEMLKYRLEVLSQFVDHFVLVEATRTFMGKPKKLYFEENTNQFQILSKSTTKSMGLS